MKNEESNTTKQPMADDRLLCGVFLILKNWKAYRYWKAKKKGKKFCEMLIEASEQAYKAATICIVNPQADEEQMFEYDESYYIHRFPTFKDYLKEINK